MRHADEATFTAFVAARSDALLRFACLLVGNVADAEDLLQVALVRLAARWPDGIHDPSAYVKKSLVNLANERWRTKKRRERLNRELLIEQVPDHATRHAEADALLRALATLPQRQRLMVVLRYVEGMSERETAQVADCSIGTVKSHASRGLARLRAQLTETAAPEHVGEPTP